MNQIYCRVVILMAFLLIMSSACAKPTKGNYPATASKVSSETKAEQPVSSMLQTEDENKKIERPPLTDEELARIDKKVSYELWGFSEEYDAGKRYDGYKERELYNDQRFQQNMEKLFSKPLLEITYRDVWCFDNRDGVWTVLPTTLYTKERYESENPPLFIDYYCYEEEQEFENQERDRLDDGTYPIGYLPVDWSGYSGPVHGFSPIYTQMKSIHAIDLSPDNVSDIAWENVVNMPNLDEVTCSSSMGGFDRIPLSFKKMSKLKRLYLNYNVFLELPDIFDAFPLLEELEMFGCEISALPPSLFQLKKLKALNLGSNNLTSIPPEIGCLESLEYLNLGSQLHKIPDEICGFSNLKYLELGQIGRRTVYDEYASPNEPDLATQLPENIGDLENLEELRINNLPIKTLPISFSNLKNLKQLTLVGVPLEALPDDIGNMTNLERINMTDDEIKTIPDSFKELHKLKFARFSDEQVTAKAKEMRESNK